MLNTNTGKFKQYQGSIAKRREFLRDLCPCRNNEVRDFETWQQLFRLSVAGSRHERDGAAHAIGTLVTMASKNQELRELLVSLKPDLDSVMREPRASRLLLGTWKKHGHARRGTALRNYRRLRKNLDPRTPEELADWVNDRFGLIGTGKVRASEKGIQRLVKWLNHRLAFEPSARTKDEVLDKQVERFLPQVFQRQRPKVRSSK